MNVNAIYDITINYQNIQDLCNSKIGKFLTINHFFLTILYYIFERFDSIN